MKKSILALFLTIVFLVAAMTGCTSKPATPSTAPVTESATTAPVVSSSSAAAPEPSNDVITITADDTDGDGIPDLVEKTYGTNPHAADTDGDGINDKQDQKPAFAENLITEKSTTVLPITITDVRVEDNETDDHLEITMKNTGTTNLSDFDIYFTITDKLDGTQEAYYVTLTNLVVNAGESATIHFDNDLAQANHYIGNMNGLFGTSANGLTFDIQLHAAGYQPMSFKTEKATGTAEVAD